MEEYKVIILGSGIAGMSCAIYLKRAGIDCLIVENNTPGGQLNKASVIENYPGYVGIQGPDLAMNIYQQVIDYGVMFCYGEVEKIDYEEKMLWLDGQRYHYQYLVFATGRRERRLELVGEEELIGRGISFCATCDGALYKNQEVVVVGGGNSAVSEALYLAGICRKVYLIYRGEQFRADEVLKERLEKSNNIDVIRQVNVLKYLVEGEILKGIRLDDGREILVSGVFLAVGSVPNSELFDGRKNEGYIVVDAGYETSRSDVYACGDVIKKELYQLVTASSEGAMVANGIIKRENT